MARARMAAFSPEYQEENKTSKAAKATTSHNTKATKKTQKKTTSSSSTRAKRNTYSSEYKGKTSKASKVASGKDQKKAAPKKQTSKATSITDKVMQQQPAQSFRELEPPQQALGQRDISREARNTFSPQYQAAQEQARQLQLQKPDYMGALEQANAYGSALAAFNPGLYLPGAVIGGGLALGANQPPAPELPPAIPIASKTYNPQTGQYETAYTYDPVTGEARAVGRPSPQGASQGYFRALEERSLSQPPPSVPSFGLPPEAASLGYFRALDSRSLGQPSPNVPSFGLPPEAASQGYFRALEEQSTYQAPPAGHGTAPGAPGTPPEPWMPPTQPPTQPPNPPPTFPPTEPPPPPPPGDPGDFLNNIPPGMSLDEALALAAQLYGPQYAELLRQRLNAMSIDLLQRGLYGQAPGQNLLLQRAAQTEAERAAQERAYAENLLAGNQQAQQDFAKLQAEWALQNQELAQQASQNKAGNAQNTVKAVIDLINLIGNTRNALGATNSTASVAPAASGTEPAMAPAATGVSTPTAQQQSASIRPAVNPSGQPLQTWPQGLYTPPNVARKPVSALGVG